MPQKIAILGLGWLGLPLAKVLFKKGYEITGSTTSSEKLMRLLKSQLAVRIIKVSKHDVSGNWRSFIKDIDVLIVNIPPGRQDKVEKNYPAQIEQIAKRCPENLKVIFVSSTSVYGNPNEEVTEQSETRPENKGGEAILAAENLIQSHFGERATILRLAGLYGPERHPGRFLSTDKPFKNPKGKINLIHLDECLELVSKVLEKDCFGEIINGCSDAHPIRADFYSKAAYALSIEPPHIENDQDKTGKTVNNEKSKNMLDMSYSDPESFLI